MGAEPTRRLSLFAALRLGRVSNLPTVWTNVVAGVVLADARLAAAPLVGLILVVSAFYVAGMYLNDAFDAAYDRVHRPTRPIPSGEAARSVVFAAAAGLVAVGLGALVAFGVALGTGTSGPAAGLALCAAIVLYDAWHKGNPIGPLLMGLCRALAYITAAAAVSGDVGAPVLIAGAVTASYLIGLTYAAKQEDLAGFGNLWPLLFLAAPFAYAARATTIGAVGLVILILLAAALVIAIWRMARGGRQSVPQAVPLLIAGISLIDGLFIAELGHAALAALTIIAFASTLGLQRVVSGT